MSGRDVVAAAQAPPSSAGAAAARELRIGTPMAALPAAYPLRQQGPVEEKAGTLRAAASTAFSVFAATRAILLADTIAVALIHRAAPWSVWNRWDSVWYAGIAEHGYHWINPGHYASQYLESTLAFFPALPALMRALAAFGMPATVGGLMIANVAFLGALIYLYLLLTTAWGPRVARRGLLLLALFPTAFFLAAPYTEPLFLLAAGGTLYHAREGQAFRAGLWLLLAALTRSTALILIVPAVLWLRPRDAKIWCSLLAPAAVGWVGYLLYLQSQHVPLAFLVSAQKAWHRGLAFPTTGFSATVDWLARNAISHWPIAIESTGGLVVTSLFLALTVRAWPELSIYSRAYCAGFWLLVLCTPMWLNDYPAPFSSVDRFVLVLFPLAGWAAANLSEQRFRLMTIAFAAMMAVCAGIHISGGWVG